MEIDIMKKQLTYCIAVVMVFLNGCQPMSQGSSLAATITPSPIVQSTDAAPIAPYQDVRSMNLTKYNARLDKLLIETLWFNPETKWPEESENVAQDILERGMNPGLGIRELHNQGITGKGVNVAIIDKKMFLDHPEFQGKIIKYINLGTSQSYDPVEMHGLEVTSLLVGENIGTAPGAYVYYAAADSKTSDAQYYADALDWIVDENEKQPDGNKIRVVSVSAAPSGPGSPFINNHAWDAAYQRATAAGILVLDCTVDRGITAPCYYDLDDSDNIGKCIPGYPGDETSWGAERIYIPSSRRTTAVEYTQGNYSYQYAGQGGLSWSVPYLAGVLALGWQVRPELSGPELLRLLFGSAYTTDDGLKIINPPAFIDTLSRTE